MEGHGPSWPACRVTNAFRLWVLSGPNGSCPSRHRCVCASVVEGLPLSRNQKFSEFRGGPAVASFDSTRCVHALFSRLVFEGDAAIPGERNRPIRSRQPGPSLEPGPAAAERANQSDGCIHAISLRSHEVQLDFERRALGLDYVSKADSSLLVSLKRDVRGAF